MIEINGRQWLVGTDTSSHQPGFNFYAAKRDGCDFAIVKATQADGYVNPYFRAHMVQALDAGLLFGSYHFLTSYGSIADQARNVARTVPKDVVVFPDVESEHDRFGKLISTPSLAQSREFIDRLRDAGYTVPMWYLPRWYWRDFWKSPDISDMPPNWHSAYLVTGVRRFDQFDPTMAGYWPVLGGCRTIMAQVSSEVAVANYPGGKIDGNFFKGSKSELVTLFGGEGDDLPSAEEIRKEVFEAPYGDGRSIVNNFQEQTNQQIRTLQELREHKAELTAIREALTGLQSLGDVARALSEAAEALRSVTEGGTVIDYEKMAQTNATAFFAEQSRRTAE